MTLGELTKCWICWESKAYAQGNHSLKQFCTPARAKKGSVCEGLTAWLCLDCKSKM